MKIVTYNINSVRIRLEQIKTIVEQFNPDIICLQETKVEDNLFPIGEVKSLGFEHIYISGQKSYNGVAILSKVPLFDVHSLDILQSDHKRHIGGRLANGVEIHNFYVPAGGDIPDRELNDKFDFKLRFYDAMSDWACEQKGKSLIMVGDFNVAPLPNDVWSHKQLLNIVSHTPIETDAMANLQKTLDWVDIARHFVPESEKLYSWWSYRNKDWEKSNRGRRLDHIWITPDLTPKLESCLIMRELRNSANPSDHVPVMMEIRD
ncbi:MAG: exodeoxyribonuclease III [Pseudomonadota bacterium]